jgi:phosphoribosylanthranilate isomerase
MALKTLVKINHVNNLSDARYCAGMGVKMIGFNLNKHDPHFLVHQKAQEIANWLSGVSIVGELSYPPEIELDNYPLDMLEVSTPSLFDEFVVSGAPLIYRFTVDNVETLAFAKEVLERYRPNVEYFLIESYLLQINRQVQELLKNLCQEYPILLGFGISANNIHEILASVAPKGIALNGGTEISAGLRDFDDLAEILESIEVDEDIEK